jgi:hypothetical protein
MNNSACCCLITLLFFFSSLVASAERISLFRDSGFNRGKLGAMTSHNSEWEVQRNGANTAQFVVTRVSLPTASNRDNRAAKMVLPLSANPRAFDSVTIGQRLRLEQGIVYEAKARVRWINTQNRARSAIISFWTQHQADKSFAGKDVWLRDGEWQDISYRFTATNPQAESLVYLSLLPNQIPARTEILVDRFRVQPVEEMQEVPDFKNNPTSKNLISDADFSQSEAGVRPGLPWQLSNGGNGTLGRIEELGRNKYCRLFLPAGTNNFTAVKIGQSVNLTKGSMYSIGADFNWNNKRASSDTAIVNFMVYHAQSGTWWGPIDHILTEGGWHRKTFRHGAPYAGEYELYVQAFGWGNFGEPLDVSVDNFSVRRFASTSQ